MKTNISKRNFLRGAVLIEFALTIPILIILVLAALEFGWALNIQFIMTDAARANVRMAATESTDPSVTIANTLSELTSMGVPNGANPTVTLTPTVPSTATRGDPITMQITIPYANISVLPTPMFLKSTVLNASVTMSKEF